MKNTIKIILAILLFLCLADMPYGYYQFVRFAAMIPKTIQKSHVRLAIQRIDTEQIKYTQTKSKQYDLVYKAKTYPPKLVISLSSEFANGEYLNSKVV